MVDDWKVIDSPTDPEMLAVHGVYLVADKLPIEDAWMISAAPNMQRALYLCQSALATMVAPDAIKQTPVINAWAQAVEAEAAARAALEKSRGWKAA